MNKEEIREDLTDRGLIFGIMPDNQGVINIDEAINYIHNLVENLSLGSVSERTFDINSCADLIKSMPIDQAIQVIKSDITGQPITTEIDGELVIAYVR